LNIKENSFSLPFPVQLPQHVNRNSVVSSFLKTFKHFVSLTKNLRYLNLNKCDINEDLASELLKGFKGTCNLNCLKLKENPIRFGGLNALVESFSTNKFLRPNLFTLDLGNTGINNDETLSLASCLLKYKAIQSISLDNNEFGDNAAEEL